MCRVGLKQGTAKKIIWAINVNLSVLCGFAVVSPMVALSHRGAGTGVGRWRASIKTGTDFGLGLNLNPGDMMYCAGAAGSVCLQGRERCHEIRLVGYY